MSVSYQNHTNGFKLEETFFNLNPMEIPLIPPDSNPSTLLSSSNIAHEADSPEEFDPSDIVLNYISQMLMDEDMEENSCLFQEALQAAEKPFYEILTDQSLPLSDQTPLYADHNSESLDENFLGSYINYNSNSSSSSDNVLDNSWISDPGKYKYSLAQTLLPTDSNSHSSFHSPTSVIDGLVESPASIVQIPELYSESESIWQFKKGVEEANKFLPNYPNLIVDLENNNGLSPLLPKEEAVKVMVKAEKKDDTEYPPNGSMGRKNLHPLVIDSDEERSNKQAAVYLEEPLCSEMFDMALLCDIQKGCEPLENGIIKNTLQNNGQTKVSNGGKSRGKKQTSKREVVDLRTLLIQCAQAVTADDRRTANELLKQIRQHSSAHGDGTQRLAYCFANALEARLACTGSQLHTALVAKRTAASDILKAYHLHLSVCPFKKMTYMFANQTILYTSVKATRLHIIDFGIYYGFQWPCLLYQLSKRAGGPPKLRITGIDLPQPGFRPTERIEQTGHRLASYAERFNVPFEYNAIAQKFETIQIEDLKIDPDEMLIVNCMFRFKTLPDETVVVESPRNAILHLIRKMNPSVFIHGIVNGAYGAPFFVTRFREALFYFSAHFDMLETCAPHESEERVLIEREFFGKEVLNAIACEGPERIERPETYKQWQVRHLRAGLTQVPLNPDIMKYLRDYVESRYHKDFVIDEDNRWMLQGWKGRLMVGVSTWRASNES